MPTITWHILRRMAAGRVCSRMWLNDRSWRDSNPRCFRVPDLQSGAFAARPLACNPRGYPGRLCCFSIRFWEIHNKDIINPAPINPEWSFLFLCEFGQYFVRFPPYWWLAFLFLLFRINVKNRRPSTGQAVCRKVWWNTPKGYVTEPMQSLSLSLYERIFLSLST